MAHLSYRYEFDRTVLMADLEMTILLAIWCCEAIHGETQARMDLTHSLDKKEGVCVADASTAVGSDFNKLLIKLIGLEFGQDCFDVCRLARSDRAQKPR